MIDQQARRFRVFPGFLLQYKRSSLSELSVSPLLFYKRVISGDPRREKSKGLRSNETPSHVTLYKRIFSTFTVYHHLRSGCDPVLLDVYNGQQKNGTPL
ncbi:hypothetical protein AVEN_108170-1 [Araneus ventricosus]|uniref:Uncharacterized protein n=1 Tax=Araneus ventricosus TaxID=182803 RepID=A0A4Y2S7T5_ARAVE|nr:hypothetical protein AVEN_108170-1 [Araneus ventricosus]